MTKMYLKDTGFYANELLNKNSELIEHMQRMVDTVDDIVKSLQQIERHECSEEAMERIEDIFNRKFDDH